VRACPLCRRVSFYVIPSDRYVSDAGRKARLNEEYHAAQRALPCRMYDQGRGVCPFGTSCFYAHLLPDGTPAPVARHTFRVNTDGEIKGVGKKPTLADFLFTK
jgi:E3 ubiquitin-protein ligase makorin